MPLAGVLVGLAARFVTRFEGVPVVPRFWAGAVLSTAAVASLAFAVIEGQTSGWRSWEVLTPFGLGAGAGTAFVVCEGRLARPLIDISLFTRPAYGAAIGVAYAITTTISGHLVGRIGERIPLVAGLVRS